MSNKLNNDIKKSNTDNQRLNGSHHTNFSKDDIVNKSEKTPEKNKTKPQKPSDIIIDKG